MAASDYRIYYNSKNMPDTLQDSTYASQFDSLEDYWTAVQEDIENFMSGVFSAMGWDDLNKIDGGWKAYVLDKYFDALDETDGALLTGADSYDIAKDAHFAVVEDLQDHSYHNDFLSPPTQSKYDLEYPSEAPELVLPPEPQDNGLMTPHVITPYEEALSQSKYAEYFPAEYLPTSLMDATYASTYDSFDEYWADFEQSIDDFMSLVFSSMGYNDLSKIDNAWKAYVLNAYFDVVAHKGGAFYDDSLNNSQLEDFNELYDTVREELWDDGNINFLNPPTTDKYDLDYVPEKPELVLPPEPQDSELMDPYIKTYDYEPGYYGVIMDDGTYTIMQVDKNSRAILVAYNLTEEEYQSQKPDTITELTANQWDEMTSATSASTSDDTAPKRELNEDNGEIFAIVNPDGTYKIIQVDDTGNADVYDPALTPDEYDDLKDDVDLRTGTPDDVSGEDWYGQIFPPDDPDDVSGGTDVQPHPADKIMNDDVNILQQVDNWGEVDIHTTKQLADQFYQTKFDTMNAPSMAEIKHFKYDGIDVYRLSDYSTPITTEEWEIIKESYKYDKDVTKPFLIKDGKYKDQPINKEYSVKYVNEWEYYYEMGQTRDFYRWLELKRRGVESRSFVHFMLEQTGEADDTDADNYDRFGQVRKLLPGIDFLDQTRNQTAKETEKSIEDTHALGINNVSAFVLGSSVCSLFSTMMLQNIKLISDNPVISRFEVTEEGSVKGLDDAVVSGMYEKGSKIRDHIENGGQLKQAQINILKIISKNWSFKTLTDFRTSNRYAEIIINIFGKQENRKHQLQNNTGIVIFNISLVLLGYYASYMDTSTSMGIDTDPTSNMIKIISYCLEVLYPSRKYDSEFLRQIENVVSEFNREIKAKHRGENTSDNLRDILLEPVSNMVHRAFSETNTNFMIDQFFDKETLDHMTSNFGLDMYMKVGSLQGLIDFILDGFVSATEFNQIVRKMMATTLGNDAMGFNGNDMFDVLFFSKTQATMMLLNPKYNVLVPLIHVETIDIVPEDKVDVTLVGFQYKIVGLVEYEKKISVYRKTIEEDIAIDVPTVEEEPVFLDKEDAEERANVIGAEGTHETEDGHRAGSSPEELQAIYTNRTEPEARVIETIEKNIENDKPMVDKEIRVMTDPEDFVQPPESFELTDKPQDWKSAGLIGFMNQNYNEDKDSYAEKFKEKIVDWKDDELSFDFEDSDNREYVVVKNEDKNIMTVMFKGSQTLSDWLSNIFYGHKDMTQIRGYKQPKTPTSRDHAGFNKAYDSFKEKLMDTVEKRSNSKTKINIISHSRGTALSNLFLENLIDSKMTAKDNIKYVGFGPIHFRMPESATQFNEKIKGVDAKYYMSQGDPLRWVNNFLPYQETTENLLVTDYEEVDGLKQILNFIQNKGITGSVKEIVNTLFAENHAPSFYEKLLAQDTHTMNRKEKNDVAWKDKKVKKTLGMALGYLATNKEEKIKSLLRGAQ